MSTFAPYLLKDQQTLDTPLLLFHITFITGEEEHFSTHAVQVEDIDYEARVLRHDVYDVQGAVDDGIDGISRIVATFSNADSLMSQLERQRG